MPGISVANVGKRAVGRGKCFSKSVRVEKSILVRRLRKTFRKGNQGIGQNEYINIGNTPVRFRNLIT